MGVILYALTSEKAVSGIERENKITFVVMLNATKKQVKEQVEKDYNEKVRKVTTLITPSGRKKAIVAFARQNAAVDLAAKLKVI